MNHHVALEIPQDIIDCVVAAVGDDAHLLKQCALVSSSFLHPSRKQLFSRITINRKPCQEIHQFLIQNPVIQHFVRSITLIDDIDHSHCFIRRDREWMNDSSLLAILRLPLCSLECFSIIILRDSWNMNAGDWNWNSFSSEMRDALSNILLSPTLKTLSLTGIAKVPLTFFHHIVHLTTLELHSLLPIDFNGANPSSLTRADSKGEAPSHTVIDRCVWHLDQDSELEPVRYVIPFICLYLANSGQKLPQLQPD